MFRCEKLVKAITNQWHTERERKIKVPGSRWTIVWPNYGLGICHYFKWLRMSPNWSAVCFNDHFSISSGRHTLWRVWGAIDSKEYQATPRIKCGTVLLVSTFNWECLPRLHSFIAITDLSGKRSKLSEVGELNSLVKQQLRKPTTILKYHRAKLIQFHGFGF